MIELLIVRLREEATLPERAYAGDAGLDLSTCERVELGPGERAVVPTGLAVAIPEGYAGFVQPRSGLAATARDRRRQLAGPDRLRLPRRDPRRPPEHRPRAHLRRRAGRPHGPARRPARARARARRAGRAARRASAACGASAPPGPDDGAAHPGVRDPAAREPGPPRPAREAGPRVLAAARRRRRAGETLLRRASSASWRRRSDSSEDFPLEGPVALADSISPPGWPPKHVVHIVFAGNLGDRSLERVTSGDEAVRNHRLFDVEELAGAGAPPADPALPRPLAARRPDGLSRLALGTLTTRLGRRSRRFSR